MRKFNGPRQKSRESWATQVAFFMLARSSTARVFRFCKTARLSLATHKFIGRKQTYICQERSPVGNGLLAFNH